MHKVKIQPIYNLLRWHTLLPSLHNSAWCRLTTLLLNIKHERGSLLPPVVGTVAAAHRPSLSTVPWDMSLSTTSKTWHGLPWLTWGTRRICTIIWMYEYYLEWSKHIPSSSSLYIFCIFVCAWHWYWNQQFNLAAFQLRVVSMCTGKRGCMHNTVKIYAWVYPNLNDYRCDSKMLIAWNS